MGLPELYSTLNPFLRPLGLPYSFLMRQRRALYSSGDLASHQPSCPCVSVGNISFGGTGKTPFCAWLLGWARRRGLKAALLTRGYRGKVGKKPLLVRPETPVEFAGDEALMLARNFPEAPVLAFPKRAVSAGYAQARFSPDLLIMDDGMQHLALARDLDIVLLRPEDLDGEWGRVIPSGSWREGPSALYFASAFAIKSEPDDFAGLSSLIHKRLAVFGKPVFSFHLAPLGLRPLFAGEKGRRRAALECPATDTEPSAAASSGLLQAEAFHNSPYLLVSGVGNPDQVEKSASAFMGRPPLQHFAFDDHYAYTDGDVQAMLKMAAAPLPIICTAKDAAKLSDFSEAFGNTPVLSMECRAEFGPALFSDLNFPDWWDEWWKKKAAAEPS